MPQHIFVREFICSTIRNNPTIGCVITPDNLSQRIGDSLIKVASTRIFAEPEQSFMELPVNSVDSYRILMNKPPTGKFGMGFFSMLYWLAEQPTRFLTIETTYLENSVAKSYKVTLTWTLQGLHLNIIPLVPQTKTGTLILLNCEAAPLTPENMERMNKHILRLADITEVNILYNDKYLTKLPRSDKSVYIRANEVAFMVTDEAQGIPWNTLITSLLIPSSSSKIRTPSIFIPAEPPTIIKSGTEVSVLTITVNDIRIIRILKYYPQKEGLIFTIRMPSNTSLPVARDDIIYGKGSFEEKNMSESISQLCMMVLKYGDITVLLDLLDEYVKYSQQVVLQNILNTIKKRIYLVPNVFFIPEGYTVYNSLRQMFPSVNFVTHPHPQIFKLESDMDTLLGKSADKTIFKLKNIVTVPLTSSTVYETGGTSRYIFVKDTYIRDNPMWKKNLLSLTQDTLLIPTDVKITDNNYYTQKISPDLQQNTLFMHAYNVLIMTWKAKSAKLIFPQHKDANRLILQIIVENYYRRVPDDILPFIAYLNSKISKIDFDYVYTNESIFVIIDKPSFYKHISAPQVENLNTFKLQLKDIIQRVAYWTVDLWPLSPLGSYKIPRLHIFYDLYHIANSINVILHNEIEDGIDMYLTEQEILTFLYIMYEFNNLYVNKTSYVKGIGRFCMEQIRHRATSDELYEMARSTLLGLIDQRLILTKVVNPVMDSLKLYLTSIDLPPQVETKLPDGYIFSCKSLLSYIFNTPHNVSIDEKELSQIAQQYATFIPGSIKLQIVEIAVNEGTTKNFMQAVLTELVQNSIDAIRTSSQRGNIDITINNSALTIIDNVGIPNNGLLALLIPFLSSKDPNDPNVTGEMGTGFFNVYRQPLSQMVTIDTTLNNRRVYIEATPLIFEGVVYDIEYNIRIQKTTVFNNTSVSVKFNPCSDLIIQSITDTKLFANNYLGFTGIETSINGQQIHKNRTKILETSIGQVYLTDDRSTQSFVMTNNVPFSLLSVFSAQFNRIYKRLLKDGSTRVIINFNKNVYTPSQSRTKVNIPTVLEKQIVSMINDGLYLAILYMYVQGDIDDKNAIIANTTSRSNVDQLYFGMYYNELVSYPEPAYARNIDLKHFHMNYQPTVVGNTPPIFTSIVDPTIVRIIDHCIDYILDERIIVTPSMFVTDPINVVWLAVGKWFSNKDTTTSEEQPVIEGSESIPFTILQPFIDIYWDICNQLLKNELLKGPVLQSPPHIMLGQMSNKGVQGFYLSSQNTIVLNSTVFNSYDITQEIKSIKEEKNAVYHFRDSSVLTKLFAPGKPNTTLIHEIFHAIQGEDHTSSGHGPSWFTINGKKDLPFNDAVNELYSLVLEHGLIEQYLQF